MSNRKSTTAVKGKSKTVLKKKSKAKKSTIPPKNAKSRAIKSKISNTKTSTKRPSTTKTQPKTNTKTTTKVTSTSRSKQISSNASNTSTTSNTSISTRAVEVDPTMQVEPSSAKTTASSSRTDQTSPSSSSSSSPNTSIFTRVPAVDPTKEDEEQSNTAPNKYDDRTMPRPQAILVPPPEPPKKRTSQTSQNSMNDRTSLRWVDTTNSMEQNPILFLNNRGYRTVRLLGEGAFAQVYEATSTGEDSSQGSEEGPQKFAIKIFDLTNQENAYWISKCLRNEMYVSKYMKHPNIVLTYEVLKTHRNGFIVMQFASGGTMESHMYERLRRPYTEPETKRYFKSLMAGLQYMHRLNVTHRDLKLDNFLLDENDSPMISDFGFAALGSKQSATVLTRLMRKTPCGTLGYMAPELFMKKGAALTGAGYESKAVDIYAMGVCLFEMFNKAKPYPSDKKDTTVQMIISQNLRYCVELSNDIKNLIASMLQIDASRRPNVDDIIKSKWLNPDALTTVLNWLGFR